MGKKCSERVGKSCVCGTCWRRAYKKRGWPCVSIFEEGKKQTNTQLSLMVIPVIIGAAAAYGGYVKYVCTQKTWFYSALTLRTSKLTPNVCVERVVRQSTYRSLWSLWLRKDDCHSSSHSNRVSQTAQWHHRSAEDWILQTKYELLDLGHSRIGRFWKRCPQ